MPKISRVNKLPTATRPGRPKAEPPKLEEYMCSRCGKKYKRQKGNFPASQSELYRGWGGYLSVCNHCVDELYNHYRAVLGDHEKAMQRMCEKFDIYWNPNIYKAIDKANTSNSRIRQYIGRTFIVHYIGKTFDDTIDEQGIALSQPMVESATAEEDVESVADDGEANEYIVDPKVVVFWGPGFNEEAYMELEMRFSRWTKDLPKPLPIVDEALYKQICIQEYAINRNIAAGKDIERGQNALNSLLSSLNVKPNQKKESESPDLESTPLGVWAKRWEDNRPIPEDDVPEPSLIKYITTWFFGHLGKAFNLRNVNSKLYDDAMDKYRVTKPEYEGEDDDEVLVDIFGEGGDGAADTVAVKIDDQS